MNNPIQTAARLNLNVNPKAKAEVIYCDSFLIDQTSSQLSVLKNKLLESASDEITIQLFLSKNSLDHKFLKTLHDFLTKKKGHSITLQLSHSYSFLSVTKDIFNFYITMMNHWNTKQKRKISNKELHQLASQFLTRRITGNEHDVSVEIESYTVYPYLKIISGKAIVFTNNCFPFAVDFSLDHKGCCNLSLETLKSPYEPTTELALFELSEKIEQATKQIIKSLFKNQSVLKKPLQSVNI